MQYQGFGGSGKVWHAWRAAYLDFEIDVRQKMDDRVATSSTRPEEG